MKLRDKINHNNLLIFYIKALIHSTHFNVSTKFNFTQAIDFMFSVKRGTNANGGFAIN